ncbi:MAG: glycosyltransferase family 4 protein [Solirubrobacteraceae bacterium]
MPPTVVHVVDTFEERGAAHQHIVAALGRELPPARYRLQAWALDGGRQAPAGPLADSKLPTRVLSFRGVQDPRGVLDIARGLSTVRPAIIHLHTGGRSRIGLLRALSSAKLVMHIHGCFGEDGRPAAFGSLLRGVHAIIATSEAVAQRVGPSATVIHPGVALPVAVSRRADERPPTIGTLARLEPIKGLETLLEAASLLRLRHPALRVEIAGRGTAERGLRVLTRRLELEDAVCFLGWRTDINQLHRRWDVFVQTARQEGFGLAALESMASGLPVVASNVGGLPELIEDGRTGFLVRVDDVAGFADRLDLLLRNETLRAELGAAARQRARDSFSAADMASSVADVYDHLLAR